ncbi:DHS-like NAD/FAD-binding domain-containing protein [Mycena leptocephala]|nr:DHS-like NAD/FAD-binding domain-containing protein [Mycena leptocephala]
MGQLLSWLPFGRTTKPGLASKDLEGVAQYIASGKCKNIVIMRPDCYFCLNSAGAGVNQRAAGIPDFRSEGGEGNLLRESNITVPRPQDIFTLSYFKKNPNLVIYQVISQLSGGAYRPTLTHSFIRLLEKRQVLNACWTQNVDDLERLAGVSSWRLIQAHGHLDSQHCTTCNANLSRVFGETLPLKFWLNLPFMKRADLLIIVGTSLAVPPFAFIADRVPKSCPRVCLGDCDEIVRRLAQLIGGGWEAQLDALWKETEDKVYRYKDGVPI